MRGPARAAGIDGCRAGWVGAIAHAGPEADSPLSTGLRRFADVDEVVAWREGETADSADRDGPVVALDVPMGLPAVAGPRACDREARALLGLRWMSVFAAPDRELLGHDFAQAREIVLRRRARHPSHSHPIMTHQTINIAPRIVEADRALREDPRRQRWLLEVHPELSFAIMAGEPLPAKHGAAGRARRLALVALRFPDAPERLAEATWRRSEVRPDDLLDAYAALWSALRFTRGRSRQLGDGSRDAFGLRRQIVV